MVTGIPSRPSHPTAKATTARTSDEALLLDRSVRIVLETQRYLREYRYLPDGLGSFAAVEKRTGQMAGRVSGMELGYRLYPAFWRSGLATEG